MTNYYFLLNAPLQAECLAHKQQHGELQRAPRAADEDITCHCSKAWRLGYSRAPALCCGPIIRFSYRSLLLKHLGYHDEALFTHRGYIKDMFNTQIGFLCLISCDEIPPFIFVL